MSNVSELDVKHQNRRIMSNKDDILKKYRANVEEIQGECQREIRHARPE